MNEQTTSKKLSPFDIINNINDKKEKLALTEINESYIPFIINKAFSQTKDTIFFANEVNCMFNLDKDIQYNFYYHLLPKKKRYGKWNKKDTSNDSFINTIQELYNYSYKKALEVLPILKDKEKGLTALLDTGGRMKK